MEIFELGPINENHLDWRASTFRGKIIARAKNELSARLIASTVTDIACLVSGKEPISNSPWEQPNITYCKNINEGAYSSDGEQGILFPEDLKIEWQQTDFKES